ncbi:unnamed protein product, partial [Rotaria sp. Silwood2]
MFKCFQWFFHIFYIQPTLIETTDPKNKLICEEIFGPVVTVYVYDDKKYDETVD